MKKRASLRRAFESIVVNAAYRQLKLSLYGVVRPSLSSFWCPRPQTDLKRFMN